MYDHTLSPQKSCLEARNQHLLELADGQQIINFIDSLSAQDVGWLVRGLPFASSVRLWRLIGQVDARYSAILLDHQPDVRIAAIIEELPVNLAIELLVEMESGDRSDVVRLLEPATRQVIFAELPESIAHSLQQELSYPEHSTGGILRTEMLRFGHNARVEDVVFLLRSSTELIEHFEQRYI